MADSENDSLSVEDLLVAFGAPSSAPAPKPRSSAKASPAKKGRSDAPAMNEDEIDLLSALGLASSASPARTQDRASANYNRADRESFKDAARKEQQIRAQQWQQELRRREARIARTQTANEEAAEAASARSVATDRVPEREDLPFMEEGGLSKSPSTPEFEDGGFERPSNYEPYQIPEPSFLASKDEASPVEGAPFAQPAMQTERAEAIEPFTPSEGSPAVQQGSVQQPVQQQWQPQQFQAPLQQAQPSSQVEPFPYSSDRSTGSDAPSQQPPMSQMPDHSSLPTFESSPELRPFGSSATADMGGFTRRVIEPLAQPDMAAEQVDSLEPQMQYPEAAVEVQDDVQAMDVVDPVDVQVSEGLANAGTDAVLDDASQAPFVEQRPFQPSGEGVVKHSFFSTEAPMSSIQRLDETEQPVSDADQESFVERKQVPLSDSTDALSTGMLGSIQPMIGSPAEGSDPYQEPSTAPAQIPAQPAFEQRPFDMQGAEGLEHMEQQPYEAAPFDGTTSMEAPIEPVTAPQPDMMQPGASMPIGGMELTEQNIALDQPQDYLTGQMVDHIGDPVAQDAYMPQQPMPPMAPVSAYPVVGAAQDDRFDIDKQQVNSKRNNILGIILIVVALLCAVMAIGMLSGLFNMSSDTQTTSSRSGVSSGAPVSDAVVDPNSTQAVYTYVVRGVDGTTHEATETATFNADGFLEGSTIELDVANAEVANALLEQLKSEFGASVVNSEATDDHVLIDLDINRDDLTKEAYTELLLANMTEFKQIS